MFAGFVVFAILGFLSKSMNVPIDTVVSSGPGLTFVSSKNIIWKLKVHVYLFLFGFTRSLTQKQFF